MILLQLMQNRESQGSSTKIRVIGEHEPKDFSLYSRNQLVAKAMQK